MSKTEVIIGFLKGKPGYAKKGANKLREILAKRGIYVSNRDVVQALKQFKLTRNIDTKNYDGDLLAIVKENNLEISKAWTRPDGTPGMSFKKEAKEELIEQLKEFKDSFLEELRNLKKCTKVYHEPQGSHLVEISLPDAHFGKVDGDSIEEQSERFLKAVKELAQKTSSFIVDRFLLPVGNDFFNTDNINYTTTKGTPQQDNTDWQTSFRVGWTTVIKAIEYLRLIAPVDVVIVQGNHDYQKTFYLGEVLESYYSKCENVAIENSINSPRKYYQYGKCLLGFTHGDKEKPQDLPLLMAKEAKKQWAESDYHEWHIGHLHKHMHNEYQGVGVKMLPSLAGQDAWHKMMGYTAHKRAQAYIWNKEKGLEGFIQINNK